MSDSQRIQRAYQALPKLFDDLDAISVDKRGVGDHRHVAEHAVLAFYRFLGTLRRDDVPTLVIDAVIALIAGLDAVDRGELHPILAPPRKKAGRPATPFDQRLVLGALLTAIEYRRRDSATSDANALEVLSNDLKQAGLKVSPAKLRDLRERELTHEQATGYSPRTSLSDVEEYQRAVRYLAERLPPLLRPIRRVR